MKHKWILVSASVLTLSGFIHLAQARDFVDLDQLCGTTVATDTQVTRSGDNHISGDCNIEVQDATLEIVGVKITVDGNLIFDDNSGETSGLSIRSSQVTTTGKVRIEGPWNEGVEFRNNRVSTGDDLRVKPVGLGDLDFRNNQGNVDGDIRLGDTGLAGDTDARNNNIALSGEFRAQSTDGDITVRNNQIRNRVDAVQIVSENGDIGVKHNSFQNSEGAQEVTITSQTGDVSVLKNRFGQSVSTVTIETDGQCESEGNSPELVNTGTCLP